MRTIVTIGFVGLLAAAQPALAANSDSNTSANRSEAARELPAQANGAPRRDRQICVRETASESHIRRQVCHTAREWRDIHGDPSNDG
jgi:hypothetical protein